MTSGRSCDIFSLLFNGHEDRVSFEKGEREKDDVDKNLSEEGKGTFDLLVIRVFSDLNQSAMDEMKSLMRNTRREE